MNLEDMIDVHDEPVQDREGEGFWIGSKCLKMADKDGWEEFVKME